MKRSFLVFLSVFLFFVGACSFSQDQLNTMKLGCEQMDAYLPLLKGKRVGVLVNHTSMIGQQHLVDSLIDKGVNVRRIFAPEHGFRGDADAGASVKDSKDIKTGIPIISLYGRSKKPSSHQMDSLDYVLFDIQDVGVRFYTYISSMHYMMEACAENKVKMLVLDRPNPNGSYVDGPVLDLAFQSFVGMHQIPVVHGLTVGELALMINGEFWLRDSLNCDIGVVPMLNYSHDMAYSLPVKPSPNLPNDQSIRLYPSLCFFEGTDVSVGRGTDFPFQVIGYPDVKYGTFSFMPISIKGMSLHPLQEGKTCYGIDLRSVNFDAQLSLDWLMRFYQVSQKGEAFFSRQKMFDLLAGTDQLRKQILSGFSEEEIRLSWQSDLDAYQEMRTKYLIYPL